MIKGTCQWISSRVHPSQRRPSYFFGQGNFLESSFDPLRASYHAAEAEKEDLRAEIDEWGENYEALKNNSEMDVNWMFLCTCFDTLNEADNEAFDLNAKFKKAKEVIKTVQKVMSSSTAEEESSECKMGPNLMDEGDEDKYTESYILSLSVQVAPSQAASSPVQVASPGPINSSPDL